MVREATRLVGSNCIPSTAINQLEMWQAETFDLATIDRELGWAEGLGMNTMLVFLHQPAVAATNTTFKSCLFFWIPCGTLTPQLGTCQRHKDGAPYDSKETE